MKTDIEINDSVRELLRYRSSEADELNTAHDYWKGKQAGPIIPNGVPQEIQRIVRMSRVNICKLAVTVPTQSMRVVGYRSASSSDNSESWQIWQANKMDRHQGAIYRSAFAHGASYALVLQGDPWPVIRGVSARNLTALYGDDPDWPVMALQEVRGGFRLFDESHIYDVAAEKVPPGSEPKFTVAEVADHGMPTCPIVRFRHSEDLDDEMQSVLTDLMPLQDQLDQTTFELLVAQHYQAFKQRYIIGWTAESEAEAVKTAANRFMMFDEDPAEVKIGEFGETNLSGYLGARDAIMQLFGVISQTPPHNLLGQMVNLSAEALVAAEVGHSRMKDDAKVSFGESLEQTMFLAEIAAGLEPDDSAEVRWDEDEARSLAQTVDALTKLQSIGVPLEILLEKVPGLSEQDVVRAKEIIAAGTSLDQLLADLDRETDIPEPV